MIKRRHDPGLLAAVKAAGNFARLAEAVNTTIQNVWQWHRVPAGRVLDVEHATGVPREVLRPDLYAAPRPKRARPSAHV
jgi:DNA-binding transcriptional regulator YdaS (Cro superfamily)